MQEGERFCPKCGNEIRRPQVFRNVEEINVTAEEDEDFDIGQKEAIPNMGRPQRKKKRLPAVIILFLCAGILVTVVSSWRGEGTGAGANTASTTARMTEAKTTESQPAARGEFSDNSTASQGEPLDGDAAASSPQEKPGWYQVDGKWRYLDESLEPQKSCWLQEGEQWYYLDQDGFMVTGEQTIDGKEYQFLDSGVWINPEQEGNGIQAAGGTTSEAETSAATADTSTATTPTADTSTATAPTPEVPTTTASTTAAPTTAAPTTAPTTAPARPAAGWYGDSKGWYYLDENGNYAASGWKRINGRYYYFDGSGYMCTGWIQDNGQWYFLDQDGRMVTGSQTINGQEYFFDDSGAMQENTGAQISASLRKPYNYLESGEIEKAVKALKTGSCSELGKTLAAGEYVYYGDTDNNGQPEGYGIGAFAGGYYYYGHWDQGVRSGDGMWIAGFGSGLNYYEGEWADNTPTGYGVLVKESGSTRTEYEGYFQDGYGMGDFTVTQETGNNTHTWYFEAYLGNIDADEAPVCEDCYKTLSLKTIIRVDGF